MQPVAKKRKDYLPWALLALGLIIFAILIVSKKDGGTTVASTGGEENTEVAKDATPEKVPMTAAPSANKDWNDLNHNAPGLAYSEINNKKINVHGTDGYAIYDLGNDILFDKDKATISLKAASNLKQVAASINKRFDKGAVRIYGYTDADGTSSDNKDLAKSRGEAVKQWLIDKGNIDEDRLSVQAIGESDPIATNETEKGKKENRRVQIVVKKA